MTVSISSAPSDSNTIADGIAALYYAKRRGQNKKNNHQNTTHHTPLSVQLVMGQYILYINTCRYLFSSKNDAKQLASCLIYAPKLASAVYWLINKQVAQPQGALTVAYKKKKNNKATNNSIYVYVHLLDDKIFQPTYNYSCSKHRSFWNLETKPTHKHLTKSVGCQPAFNKLPAKIRKKILTSKLFTDNTVYIFSQLLWKGKKPTMNIVKHAKSSLQLFFGGRRVGRSGNLYRIPS